jgi:hypothetical protein
MPLPVWSGARILVTAAHEDLLNRQPPMWRNITLLSICHMYMNRPGIKAIDLYHWMDERGGSIELDFRPHFDWGRHTLDMEGCQHARPFLLYTVCTYSGDAPRAIDPNGCNKPSRLKSIASAQLPVSWVTSLDVDPSSHLESPPIATRQPLAVSDLHTMDRRSRRAADNR